MLLSDDDACAPKLYSQRILNSPRGGLAVPAPGPSYGVLSSRRFCRFSLWRLHIRHVLRLLTPLFSPHRASLNTHTRKKMLHASLKYLRSARLSRIRNLTKQTQATVLFILSEWAVGRRKRLTVLLRSIKSRGVGIFIKVLQDAHFFSLFFLLSLMGHTAQAAPRWQYQGQKPILGWLYLLLATHRWLLQVCSRSYSITSTPEFSFISNSLQQKKTFFLKC